MKQTEIYYGEKSPLNGAKKRIEISLKYAFWAEMDGAVNWVECFLKFSFLTEDFNFPTHKD